MPSLFGGQDTLSQLAARVGLGGGADAGNIQQANQALQAAESNVIQAADVFKGLERSTNREVDFFREINRYRESLYTDPELPSFWYVFMTTPHLNFAKSNIENNEFLSFLYHHDRRILDALSYPEATNSRPFIYPMTNAIKGFDPTDLNAQLLQLSVTSMNHAQGHVGKDGDSRSQVTLNLNFSDKQGAPILRMIHAWYEYVRGLTTGTLIPSDAFRKERKIDFMSSLYYFVTGPDNLFLTHWGRYLGVFPINVPFSAYAKKLGEAANPLDITGQFACSFVQHMYPSTLVDFNNIVDGKVRGTLTDTIGDSYNTVKRWLSNPFQWVKETVDPKDILVDLPKVTLTSENDDLSIYAPSNMRIHMVRSVPPEERETSDKKYKPAIVFSSSA